MGEEEMWRAVEARDASVDGKFVLAVRTTCIYCRPSCPSRHPKRENVEFYPTPEAAEAAGYRPCLRCKPRDTDAPQIAWVKKACDYIRRRPEEKITLESLSREAGVSAYHLQRTFKRVMGVSPRQYQETCRIERLKGQLREGKPVTKAVYGAGYGSTSWLYRDSKAKLGMTPGAYRRRGEGMSIRYRIVDSPLGRLIVARTGHGVCYLGIWDDEETLEASLRAEYPRAELTREEGKPDPWTRGILEYLAGRASELGGIPVDVVGTEFQRRVWGELQAIPRGQTRTYGDVARSMGRPEAVRAVGRACATNPVSLLIPCHRVVGKSGDLHGYHWGLDCKKTLLEAEKRTAAP
ncbi:MAG: bifunctional DNA-binding transcriptional regulator/O6-methylguanine-DNA methyltransferase Ada [Candidatus Bathyarchaeota archaeon]|nr:bifunctional DNA-binding transcriptional regulator/O6-methylguanine-DNA methyltransferase Ada [Candidatus Bathyarchaeota archaeon]